MAKFLFRKVEAWVVILLVIFFVAFTCLFAMAVRDRAFGANRMGAFGNFAFAVASAPSDAMKKLDLVLQGDPSNMATDHSDRFPGQSGWTFHEAGKQSGLDGYLLFSRYDGDIMAHVFELVDLKSGETVYRMELNGEALFADARRDSRMSDPNDWTTERFRAIHPITLENGDILVKGHRTPLVRMTPCGKPVWILDKEMFHHTTEPGLDGTFWLTNFIEPPEVKGLRPNFKDPGIVQIDADGNVLFERSFADILLKNGLGHLFLVNEVFNLDTLHLNDVEPVLEDGPYWKRGDVFVSIRHLSAIMLYRPSTDEILWVKQGPWAAQHDVDIINDHTISVYNNNAFNFGSGMFVDGNTDITFYDFATDSVSSPLKDAMVANDVRNESEGLFTLTPDGHALVSETASGRTLIFTPEGALAAEHINRAKSGLIYHIGWSRYLDRAEGDELLAAWQAADCG